MKLMFTLISFSILITGSSCHRYYTSKNFAEKTALHKVVAILPPQMIITGNYPKSFSKKDIFLLEEKESKVFQEALFNNILRRSGDGKTNTSIQLQPHNNTLSLFEKNKISIRESWNKSDKELAEILQVDAVVRSTIQKERFMSDAASAGVEAGRRILDGVLKTPVLLPNSISKTSEIHATCSLISNGETLWNDTYVKNSNYNYSANNLIEDITDKFAKHFPYGKKS